MEYTREQLLQEIHDLRTVLEEVSSAIGNAIAFKNDNAPDTPQAEISKLYQKVYLVIRNATIPL